MKIKYNIYNINNKLLLLLLLYFNINNNNIYCENNRSKSQKKDINLFMESIDVHKTSPIITVNNDYDSSSLDKNINNDKNKFQPNNQQIISDENKQKKLTSIIFITLISIGFLIVIIGILYLSGFFIKKTTSELQNLNENLELIDPVESKKLLIEKQQQENMIKKDQDKIISQHTNNYKEDTQNNHKEQIKIFIEQEKLKKHQEEQEQQEKLKEKQMKEDAEILRKHEEQQKILKEKQIQEEQEKLKKHQEEQEQQEKLREKQMKEDGEKLKEKQIQEEQEKLKKHQEEQDQQEILKEKQMKEDAEILRKHEEQQKILKEKQIQEEQEKLKKHQEEQEQQKILKEKQMIIRGRLQKTIEEIANNLLHNIINANLKKLIEEQKKREEEQEKLREEIKTISHNIFYDSFTQRYMRENSIFYIQLNIIDKYLTIYDPQIVLELTQQIQKYIINVEKMQKKYIFLNAKFNSRNFVQLIVLNDGNCGYYSLLFSSFQKKKLEITKKYNMHYQNIISHVLTTGLMDKTNENQLKQIIQEYKQECIQKINLILASKNLQYFIVIREFFFLIDNLSLTIKDDQKKLFDNYNISYKNLLYNNQLHLLLHMNYENSLLFIDQLIITLNLQYQFHENFFEIHDISKTRLHEIRYYQSFFFFYNIANSQNVNDKNLFYFIDIFIKGLHLARKDNKEIIIEFSGKFEFTDDFIQSLYDFLLTLQTLILDFIALPNKYTLEEINKQLKIINEFYLKNKELIIQKKKELIDLLNQTDPFFNYYRDSLYIIQEIKNMIERNRTEKIEQSIFQDYYNELLNQYQLYINRKKKIKISDIYNITDQIKIIDIMINFSFSFMDITILESNISTFFYNFLKDNYWANNDLLFLLAYINQSNLFIRDSVMLYDCDCFEILKDENDREIDNHICIINKNDNHYNGLILKGE